MTTAKPVLLFCFCVSALAAVALPADETGARTARGSDVFRSLRVKVHEKHELRFEAPSTPPGREAVLTLKARLDNPKVAGYNPALRVWLNGKPLGGERLLDRPLTMTMANGQTQSAVRGDHLTVPYAPDFDATDTHPYYALHRVNACRFALRVTDLLKQGTNVLVVENGALGGVKHTLAAAAARIEFRIPVGPKSKAGPPRGPLPVFTPASVLKVDYAVEQQPNNDLLITAGGKTFRVESQFSTPEGKWQKRSNRYFTVGRQIEKRGEAVIVRDTFTNLTAEDLPLMQRHLVAMKPEKVWLAGLSPASRTGSDSEPKNPTTFALVKGPDASSARQPGIGLMAIDDVFQVHVRSFSDGKSFGLADDNFVLRPRATHTAEWAILPVIHPASGAPGAAESLDAKHVDADEAYFSFVNAARRLRDVNFTIDGGFAFLRADPRHIGKWSDEQVAAFIKNKSARYLSMTITYPRYHGLYPHGTAFQTLKFDEWKKELRRRRALAPHVKHLAYFHCFIDVLDGAEQKYADARVLRGDGSQAIYGQPYDKIFFPTETNTFGRDVAKNVDMILGKIGCDGVYWDEMAYSRYRYHYGEPWDGCSADIDPQTMRIRRLKSSVTLVTGPWRVALAKRILARGPLIANGAPHTRTMANLHFPRFVETGSISHCTGAQLFTPIALGDHLTERSEVDAYRVMLRALDYGCVYYWYNDLTVVPTHPHLTRFMFPITPLELHKGFIIGEERIITNRSGLFGWGDDSGHEVSVFDDAGRRRADFKAPTVRRGKRTLTELRIAEGWSAAVIRKNPHSRARDRDTADTAVTPKTVNPDGAKP